MPLKKSSNRLSINDYLQIIANTDLRPTALLGPSTYYVTTGGGGVTPFYFVTWCDIPPTHPLPTAQNKGESELKVGFLGSPGVTWWPWQGGTPPPHLWSHNMWMAPNSTYLSSRHLIWACHSKALGLPFSEKETGSSFGLNFQMWSSSIKANANLKLS